MKGDGVGKGVVTVIDVSAALGPYNVISAHIERKLVQSTYRLSNRSSLIPTLRGRALVDTEWAHGGKALRALQKRL